MLVGGITTIIEGFVKERKQKQRGENSEKLEENSSEKSQELDTSHWGITKKAGFLLFLFFIATVLTLLLLKNFVPTLQNNPTFFVTELMLRVGSLIYGGGQVVLPMLLTELVSNGWMSESKFLDGLAIAQSMPGPLFNISAYIGAALGNVGTAVLAWAALFLPGVILITAFLPWWAWLRQKKLFQLCLPGVNAAAIGLVIAAVFSLLLRVMVTPFDCVVVLWSGVGTVWLGWPAPAVVGCGGVAGVLKWVAVKFVFKTG
jgi:chromate transporter